MMSLVVVSSCSKRGTYEAATGAEEGVVAVSSCSKRGTYEAREDGYILLRG